MFHTTKILHQCGYRRRFRKKKRKTKQGRGFSSKLKNVAQV